MDDLVRVHVVARADKLNHIVSGFWLGKTASATKHIHQGAIVTKLEGHINVLFVFKAFLEADDVRVFKRTMDLDFGIKL